MVFGFELEALLGRYQMHCLDRSQGPPVYPGYERAKSVNGIAGWNFWMITTVELEYARALQLTIDSNLPDQTRSVQTKAFKEREFSS